MFSPEWLKSMGYAFPCTFCERMAAQKGREYPACEMENCGGPFVGRSFPMYKGPLTRATLATSCFRCGGEAEEALVLPDGGYVGVCKVHLNSTVPTSSDTLVPVQNDA